jgi:hypothetical protein
MTALKLIGAASIVLACTFVVEALQTRPDAEMTKAARALMAAVGEGPALAKLVWKFEDEERFNWHFIPRERKGLPLKEMTEPQRQAAMALLKTGLSASGYSRAEAVRSLEDVLFAQSKSPTRDRENYYFTIFGTPGGDRWAWRYEGHHLAQNWTIVSGKAIATTPAFFGANPAEVMDGPLKGTRALKGEADLGWAFLAALTDEQRKTAVVSEKAPNDILTANSRKAAIQENSGVAFSSLTQKQQAMLMALVAEHANAQAPALAAARMAKVKADTGSIRFAWMGATTPAPGAAHYYRIQGAAFLIEYDNTQNRANHQHIVWRDFNGDFGDDLLAMHYAASPHTVNGAVRQ